MLKIITDNKTKQFKTREDVPGFILASRFSYLEDGEGNDGFFQYRGEWYHVSDFMINPGITFMDWDGYTCDSYWTGTLIKVYADSEYTVGRYMQTEG